VKNIDQASAVGCAELPAELADCTPFSGHLISLLRHGTEDDSDELTLGMIRDAVEDDMSGCGTEHDQPRMILNDARENVALFTNQMARSGRRRRLPIPASAEDWVRAIKYPNEDDLNSLLADPQKAGRVVAILSRKRDGNGQTIARHVNERADREFRLRRTLLKADAEALAHPVAGSASGVGIVAALHHLSPSSACPPPTAITWRPALRPGSPWSAPTRRPGRTRTSSRSSGSGISQAS
jgi:hypothetical protein